MVVTEVGWESREISARRGPIVSSPWAAVKSTAIKQVGRLQRQHVTFCPLAQISWRHPPIARLVVLRLAAYLAQTIAHFYEPPGRSGRVRWVPRIGPHVHAQDRHARPPHSKIPDLIR